MEGCQALSGEGIPNGRDVCSKPSAKFGESESVHCQRKITGREAHGNSMGGTIERITYQNSSIEGVINLKRRTVDSKMKVPNKA